MKKFLFIIGLIAPVLMYGQDPQMTTQSGNDSLIKPLVNPGKAKLLNNVDMIFNTRIANDNYFSDGKFEKSEFNNNQFRLEIKGNITDKVYFRFRDRYTKNTAVGSEDHLSHSIDYAMVGMNLTDKFTLNFGKMSTAWGGWEFDLNPIDILEYNDILENADNFLTGVGGTYQFNKNHSFTAQIMNSRTDKFELQYAGSIPAGVEASKAAFAYVTQWNGKFFDGKFETLYSYSYFTEAQKKGMNYWSFGNKYEAGKWRVMYDFKYSNEGLDRKGIVTGLMANVSSNTAQDVSYLEHWLRADYRVSEKVGVSMTLMSSKASAKDVNPDSSGMNGLRTSYGVIPELSYYPFKNQNMRFYASYVGRWYDYTDFAKEQLGQVNNNTGRLSVGFIAPLLIF